MTGENIKITRLTQAQQPGDIQASQKPANTYLQMILLEHLSASIQALETRATKKTAHTEGATKTANTDRAKGASAPTPSGSPPNFDPSVPSNYTSLWEKILLMFKAIKDHPGNLKVLETVFKFFMNLFKSPIFKAHEKDLIKLLKSLNLDVLGHKLSFIAFLAAAVALADFAKNGDQDDGSKELEKLISELKKLVGSLGDNPDLKKYLEETLDQLKYIKSVLTTLMNGIASNGQGDPSTYLIILGGYLNDVLNKYFDLNKVIGEISKKVVSEILKSTDGNATFALMLWFLISSETSVESELSGLGDLGNFLANASDLINKILEQLQAGNFTPASAKEFIKELLRLQSLVGHYAGTSSIAKSFIDEINKLLNIKNIGQDFRSGNFDKLAKDLNGLIPKPGEPPSADYEAFLNTLKQLGNQITNQQQTLNIQVSQTSSLDQTVINTFKGTITGDSGVVGLINAMIKNQISR